VIATHKWLFAALLALSSIGVLAIYSCTHAEAGGYFATRQLVWIGLGFAAMVLMTAVKTRTLSSFSPLIYLGAIGLLVLVLVAGKGPQGTRRWFDLGFFRFQPSEVAKFATLLMLARYLAEKRNFGNSIRSILFVFAVVGLPAVLTLYEPDLGTSIVLALLAFPMLYVAGLDPLYLLLILSPLVALVCSVEVVAWAVFVALLLLLVLLGKFKTSLVTLVFGADFLLYSLGPRLWESLAPYQRDRVLAFLHPEDYRHGAGFQIIQSKIAIGSGGFIGKGFLGGTQKALGLVPEQHTDFLFSVIGEEWGFLGSLLVLLLLFFVVWRLFRLAGEATNRFSVYFCFGLASLLLLQVSINIGMTLGLMPVTGLPLPFLSYGGSQAVVFWGMIGAALAAHASAKGL
jgi:rod shape determining protein RodA